MADRVRQRADGICGGLWASPAYQPIQCEFRFSIGENSVVLGGERGLSRAKPGEIKAERAPWSASIGISLPQSEIYDIQNEPPIETRRRARRDGIRAAR
jgi:hypothetical protein